MDQLLANPMYVVGQTVIGALLLISLYINRFLYIELSKVRSAYEAKVDKLNEARMEDMRSIDRLAEGVEKLGDKLIDVAVERRRA